METPAKKRRVQKICTIWVHEKAFSEHDVVVNLDHFAELDLRPGSLAKVSPLGQAIAVRDFQHPTPEGEGYDHANGDESESASDAARNLKTPRRERRSSISQIQDESAAEAQSRQGADHRNAYVFVVQDAPSDLKSKHAGLHISVSTAIAGVFGFRNRMQVVVTRADSRSWATHVEVTIKDQYLARSDMWRMVSSELADRTVYRDQKLLFMGSIKATVKHIWRDGHKRKSGFYAPSTKCIFRSESARYVLFIQMSKEMWDFDAQGSGEIMFNKVINGFLPELFKKWTALNAKHLITIVLFTRIDYDRNRAESMARNRQPFAASQDFYRVVVNDTASGDWVKILHQLKKEFRTFLRGVTVQPAAPDTRPGEDGQETGPLAIISGKPGPASKGNILEAINLASAQFAKDYIDRDLVRTGISIVIITAGTGIFEVDYSMLKLTTDTLVSSGIGMDLVCLSPMPLHSVPLFKYQNPRNTNSLLATSLSQSLRSANTVVGATKVNDEDNDDMWRYVIPHWIDVSFWSGSIGEMPQLILSARGKRHKGEPKRRGVAFSPRCRLHELQMMGIMENDMSNISIRLLHEHSRHPWHHLKNHISGVPVTSLDRGFLRKLDRLWMDQYDQESFDVGLESDPANGEVTQATGSAEARPAHATKENKDEDSDDSAHPHSNFLEWKLKDKRQRPPKAIRKNSSASLASTTSGMTVKTPLRLSSQLNFGAGRFGASKPAALAELTLASGTIQAATFAKHDRDNQVEDKTGFTEKFRASLNRSVSQAASPAPSTAKVEEPPEAESHSKPIAIGKQRGPAVPPPDVARSEDTVREGHLTGKTTASPKDSSAIFYAASASQRIGLKPSLSSSAEAGPSIPKTLSPTSALAPWLVLVNPSNPKKNNHSLTSQFKRWQHVFPKPTKVTSIKWKSLCSPASVPLTNEYFPSPNQMKEEYHESSYTISPVSDDSSISPSKARDALVREMVSLRLTRGFQFIIGPAAAEWLGVREEKLSQIFHQDYMSKDGDCVLLSVGNTIHRITCSSGNQISVLRYNRKSPAGMEYSSDKPFNLTYKSYVRTALAPEYELQEFALKPPRLHYNWNPIDNYLADHDIGISEALRSWKSRFVLIPVSVPKGRRNLPVHTEDTAEELRLEGIYKLTQLWQRNRVLDEEQRLNLRSRSSKDVNPLAIEFQTRDPSAVVAAGPDSSLLADQEGGPIATLLFNDVELHESSSIDLPRLAQDLQGDKGVRMLDRKWHWRVHNNCFLGFDLTTWLLRTFRDVETRDEAVELGNKLMEKGLFQHVQKKHTFRDGQFFYQIAAEYRIRPESRASWFRPGKSLPATPSGDVSKNPLATARTASRPATSTSGDATDDSSTNEEEGRRQVQLSRMMRYDLDPRKKSYRPEVIDLHYDRLHNPDNCYHIRIEWLNVTAKLVEDAIVSWASTVERYGLKLVEVPLAEARLTTETSPFRSPYLIELIEPPPSVPAHLGFYDASPYGFNLANDQFMYHKALLRRLDFVLDAECASSFPTDVDVSYSWGKPQYQLTQYIHRTGTLLVQIRDDGSFLLAANRLCNNQSAAVREAAKFEKHDLQKPSLARRGLIESHGSAREKEPARWSPFTSPAVHATPALGFEKPNMQSPDAQPKTAEELKDMLESCCRDVVWLRSFYAEALKPRASPSPRLAPVPDDKIPMLGLPPILGSRLTQQSPRPPSSSGRESALGRLSVSSEGSELETSAEAASTQSGAD